MNTDAALTILLASPAAQSSLRSVLTPDNEGAPHGTRLSMEGRGSRLEFTVASASPSAALSIILAILRDVTLFQEVWLLSHGKGGRVRRV